MPAGLTIRVKSSRFTGTVALDSLQTTARVSTMPFRLEQKVAQGESEGIHRAAIVLSLALLLAGPSWATPQEHPNTASTPNIGTIVIVTNDVFEERPGVIRIPYVIANKIHISTRERVIQRELLFTVGDPLSQELIEQTERNLRALRFLRDARIETTLVDTNGDGVIDQANLLVQTWDTWSLSPRLDFSSIDVRSTWEIGASEKNLFGLGKEVSVSRRQTLDRGVTRLLYRDQQLGGSRFILTTSLATLTDGNDGYLALERPFFSLQDQWSIAVKAGGFARDDPLIEAGKRVDHLRHTARWADLEFGRAIRRQPTGALRLHAAYRLRKEEVGPERRQFGIVEVGLSSTEHRFVQRTHVNRFERTEDFNLGSQSLVTAGISTPQLGGQGPRALFFSASHQQAIEFSPAKFFIGNVQATGRSREGSWENALITVGVRYLQKHALRHALLGRLEYKQGHRLDPEVQLRLGADNGLRGYPVRQFVGTRTLLFSAEERWFIADDIGQLVSMGLAAFVDSGFAWPDGRSVHLRDLRTAIGASLLVGSNRLSSRPGIRFDFGYALNPESDVGRWVFVTGSDIQF